MRFTIFILVLLAIDFYSFQAVRLVAQNWSPTTKNIAYGLFWSLTAFTIFYLLAHSWGWADGWSKNMETYSRTFVFIIYISKLLIVPLLLIDDLRRLFTFAVQKYNGETNYDISRSKFLGRMGVILGAIPFFTLTYGIVRNPYRYRVFQQSIGIKGLSPKLVGLKIVQISDIHSGSFTFKEPVRNAIEMINAQKADLVFFTGDLVNDHAEEMTDFMDVFDKIEAKYGVYSVLGNHDYGDYHRWDSDEAKEANLDKLKGIHKTLGWNLLLNEHRILEINDEKIAVIGVENYSALPQFPKKGRLADAHQGSDGVNVKLLLSHDPSHWDFQIVPEFKDINVTFSGHTHGFQFGIEIPGWIKWSPARLMYKQWAGLYQQGEQFLYVNRGLGFLGYPGRVGILPEVTVIELQSA
jgi:predicted MPP superfamily phosphohydrolase